LPLNGIRRVFSTGNRKPETVNHNPPEVLVMNFIEQRRFERYFAPERAIANLKPYSEFGSIHNISRGGVSFDYLFFPKNPETDPEIGPHREIDIFCSEKGLRPITLPCRVVRVEERLVGSYYLSVIPKKRCGVQFTGFDRETASALDSFLVQCKKCIL
jgi:hypothetical protein